MRTTQQQSPPGTDYSQAGRRLPLTFAGKQTSELEQSNKRGTTQPPHELQTSVLLSWERHTANYYQHTRHSRTFIHWRETRQHQQTDRRTRFTHLAARASSPAARADDVRRCCASGDVDRAPCKRKIKRTNIHTKGRQSKGGKLAVSLSGGKKKETKHLMHFV